ncbi:hypothetical protein HerbRD11066_18880 [Herbidospora sp. RD11066]
MTRGIMRVGASVRRPASASSEFVAALLALFEQRGFGGAPRYLGRDGDADLFGYIPGEVPSRFQVWDDAQIAAAGRLLRSMHDATRGSALVGHRPVVCHHDAGPNDAVFQVGLPVAWIDFDTAAPGDPLEDVGYAAWTWCISSKKTQSVERQAAQVRLLADAYGLDTSGPQRMLLGRDPVVQSDTRRRRHDRGRIAWSLREAAFTAEHREAFEAALT